MVVAEEEAVSSSFPSSSLPSSFLLSFSLLFTPASRSLLFSAPVHLHLHILSLPRPEFDATGLGDASAISNKRWCASFPFSPPPSCLALM